MFRNLTAGALTAALLAYVATDARAQLLLSRDTPQTKAMAGSSYIPFGNSYLGGNVQASARFSLMRSGSTRAANGNFRVSAYANFLKSTSRVAYVSGSVHSDNYSSNRNNSRLYAYLGSLRVVNDYYSGGPDFHAVPYLSKGLDLFAKDPSYTFSIAYVPITIKGNVGVGVSTGAGFTLRNGLCGIKERCQAWAYGRASAAAGIKGFNIGLQVIARLGNQKLEFNTYADAFTWRITGSIDYLVRAISLKLKAWVTIIWQKSTTLASWSSAEKHIANLLTF